MRVRRGNRYAIIKRQPSRGGFNPFAFVSDVVDGFGDFIADVPIVGDGLKGVYDLTFSAPFQIADSIASGKRLDRVALDTLKNQIQAVKAVAPYAQTVISFVPGVGTGVSAAIGASVALAEGKTIDQAMVEAVKGALPGGPAARAAFEVAEGIASGQPIDQIAIDAAPISTAAKRALRPALQMTKDIARGKNVSGVVISEALKQLPPQAQRVALAVKGGQPIDLAEAILKESMKLLPPDAREAFDIGTTVGNAVHLQQIVQAPTVATLEKVLNLAKQKLSGFKKSGIGEMMALIEDIANHANEAAQAVGGRVRSPIVQNTKAGLAVTYPVGVPVTAMVAAAGAVLSASRSAIPDRANAAKKLLVNTALASQMGDLGARRALQTLAIVAKARPGRVGVSLGRAISPARIAWLKRQKSTVRRAWAKKHAHLPRVMAEYNRIFYSRRPPTLKAGPKKAPPPGSLAAAEKRGEMRATLRAIKAMRDKGRTGIMMGSRQIDHGQFVEVP